MTDDDLDEEELLLDDDPEEDLLEMGFHVEEDEESEPDF